MISSCEYIEVITTFATSDEAKSFAKKVLENKLATCCSIEEIESIYRWKGKVENEHELQLTIKTTVDLYDAVEKFIIQNHSYETPQIICLPIINGSKDYLEWIKQETK